MIDTAALDQIIRQTAAIDSADAITGPRGRSVREVLQTWLEVPDALGRVLPLILVRYRVKSRQGVIPLDPLPTSTPTNEGSALRGRRMFGPRITDRG